MFVTSVLHEFSFYFIFILYRKAAIFDFKKNDPQFMKKMVEKIESFLTSIQISEVDLDNDVINYSQENQDWLQGFYDPNDWAEIW